MVPVYWASTIDSSGALQLLQGPGQVCWVLTKIKKSHVCGDRKHLSHTNTLDPLVIHRRKFLVDLKM